MQIFTFEISVIEFLLTRFTFDAFQLNFVFCFFCVCVFVKHFMTASLGRHSSQPVNETFINELNSMNTIRYKYVAREPRK